MQLLRMDGNQQSRRSLSDSLSLEEMPDMGAEMRRGVLAVFTTKKNRTKPLSHSLPRCVLGCCNLEDASETVPVC
jgi:hypothetical protein